MTISELKIIRREAVLNRFGMSKTWLNDRIKNGLMPPAIPLGGRAVGWLKHEVDAVLAAMSTGASDDNLKHLVFKLVEQREYLADESPAFHA